MPLERLVLLIVIVMAAAGLTIWVGSLIVTAWALPWYGSLALISISALVLYILGRTIGERLTDRDDDKYDRIDN